jgi:hypothetical protein
MSGAEPEDRCGCRNSTADAAGSATRTTAEVRVRLVAGAEHLGVDGDDLAGLVAVYDAGDCAATHTRLAELVHSRLAAEQQRAVASVRHAADLQVTRAGDSSTLPPSVVDQHDRTVTALGSVARLRAATAVLATVPVPGRACDVDCACVAAASAETSSDVAPFRMPLTDVGGSDIVCTLDGGVDAMRTRIGQWQAVLDRATDREHANGGVTLHFNHDAVITAELARLAAAEFACCSFFTFALTVGPSGVQFTVTAPDEARDVITAVFGAAPSVAAGGER